MLVGYACVSTQDQNLHLQHDALKQAGCHKIFDDKISGSTRQRDGRDKALAMLREGDTLVLWSIGECWVCMSTRKPCPSDVSDDEWEFVAYYLNPDEPNCTPARILPYAKSSYSFFKGLRWMARAGAPWKLIPNNLPPGHSVYEQTQRWIVAECSEAIVHDLRESLRVAGAHPKSDGDCFRGVDTPLHTRKRCKSRF